MLVPCCRWKGWWSLVEVAGRFLVRLSSSSLRIESWKSNCKNLCRDGKMDNNSVESEETVCGVRKQQQGYGFSNVNNVCKHHPKTRMQQPTRHMSRSSSCFLAGSLLYARNFDACSSSVPSHKKLNSFYHCIIFPPQEKLP